MTEIYHLNCVKIVSPYADNVCGHCLLLKQKDRMVLIDTGIGLLDSQLPEQRIGHELVEITGYRFDESQTAVRQIERLGLNPEHVGDCIISHLDNDHIGGLADFPHATVHVGREEYEHYMSGSPRYLKIPLQHNPDIKTYEPSDRLWFGLEARKVATALDVEMLLIPLPGHTFGHCGIAIKNGDKWLFYVADAYYLREELSDMDHPVHELAEMRADDNKLRIDTLEKIRRLMQDHPEIEIFGYHDISEFEYYNSK
ncbi:MULTISPECIES: MBL fold metallo-hydrolase [Sphingobacterium]|uniref:MBL fold metallo-hydrolase n=1 Tax=Sphingobacterium suaedae TaxID=1686402 RepID=A0ABW5KDI4_9SPHI